MATTLDQTPDGNSYAASASLREYGEAVALTLIAWGGRELLTPIVGPVALPYIFFFPAVAAAAWRGGTGPGALSEELSLAIAVWRFLPPGMVNAAADIVTLLSFVLSSALIVGPIAALRRTRSHLNRQLEAARRVEAELAAGREAAGRLAAIVEYSGDAIFTKDLDGVVRTWNASAERLFGYTAEEIVGKPIAMLLPPDRIEEERATLTRLRSGQPVERMETVRVTKGGRHIRVSLSMSPLRDSSGEIVGASKIVHDITEIAEAREALDRERQLLKTTLASIGDAVIVTDTEGRVTFLNGEAERLTGWTDADARGIELPTVFHIINEHTREIVENPVDKVRRLGIVVGLANHTILIGKNGTESPIDDSAAPIRHDGVEFGVVLVFRDVTERKKAEDALRLADRKKDEFLAVLSHELRNPLNPIQLAAAMLKQIGPQQPELIQLHDVIDRQARQMGRLLDDLLDVSRISSGKITLRKERVGLAAAITMAIEASRTLIDSFGHELVVNLAPEPIEVDGDVGRLAQVIGNLLNNAAKFTDRGGRIEVTLERRGNQAVVRVRDNGAGVAADQWPHIFEMFGQGDRTLERSHGGLGVGLSLARTVVELHGGTLDGSSDGPDRGSEFVVTLPIMSGARPAGTAQPAAPLRAETSFRILIADDNVDSATTLAAGLGHAGHDVRTVPDGLAVLEHVNDFKPHVVILDIGMPGLNGYDVARRLRDDHGRTMLLVAVTGWGQEEDKRQARDAGFDHHLTKPITLELIHRVLSASR